MFQKTESYSKIMTELNDINALYKSADFKCYADNIFTFVYIDNNILHEFNFISTGAIILFYNMQINEILNLDSISYFNHNIYLYSEIKLHDISKIKCEKIGSITWTLYNNAELN